MKRRVEITGSLARSVLDSLDEGVVLFGARGEIVDCNDSALRIFGLRARDVIGRDFQSLGLTFYFDDGTRVTAENGPERQTLASGDPARDVLLRWDADDGEQRWLLVNYTPLAETDGPGVVVASVTDITERRRAEQQVAFLAYHDPLTELPNRTLLAEHLEQGLARARRYGRSVALLYIDLDGFKLVNDSFGHAAGDELLSRIAARLREGTRSADLLARQGGDEFLLLLTDIEGDVQAVAERAAQTIRVALEAPFVLRGAEVQMGASVGIGIFPRDAQSARGLLQFADQSMYRAKGPSRRQPVHRESDPLERLAMTTRLRNALAAGEFILHWQPVFSLADGRLASIEALLRWQDPERGLIAAGEFIPMAEQMGLTERIDSWVVDAIARQARTWQAEGLDPRMSFNLSGRDLRQPALLASVAEKLSAGDLDPASFTVEVSEASAVEEGGRLDAALRELHEAGLGIAIDRFNSGLSSLRRMRDLPLAALKIDQACVAAAAEDEAAASLVTGIIGFASALGVTAIAEGVETEAQRRFLVDHGCPSAQGFHLGRPAGTAETTALLHREHEAAS